MDYGTTLPTASLHLSGIRKTLRRLFVPTSEPNAAIIRALQDLARCERIEALPMIAEAPALSPAA